MTAQKGRDLLLKLSNNDSPETFTTIAGSRQHSITVNNGELDVTNKDDAGVQKLLAGLYGKSITISAQGVFMDDSGIAAVRAAALAGTHLNFQLVIPGSTADALYEGLFRITSFEESGGTDTEVGYSFTLKSTDAVSVT